MGVRDSTATPARGDMRERLNIANDATNAMIDVSCLDIASAIAQKTATPAANASLDLCTRTTDEISNIGQSARTMAAMFRFEI